MKNGAWIEHELLFHINLMRQIHGLSKCYCYNGQNHHCQHNLLPFFKLSYPKSFSKLSVGSYFCLPANAFNLCQYALSN